MFAIHPVTLIDRIHSAMIIAAITADAMEITEVEIETFTPEEVDLVLKAQLAHMLAVTEIIVCTEILCN